MFDVRGGRVTPEGVMSNSYGGRGLGLGAMGLGPCLMSNGQRDPVK